MDFGLNVGAFTLNNFKNFNKIVAVEASSDCLDVAKENLITVPVGKIDFIHAAYLINPMKKCL